MIIVFCFNSIWKMMMDYTLLMKGKTMIELRENSLSLKEYLMLRASVNWKVLNESQAKKALENSLLTVAAYEDNKLIGMGRIVGDGAVICYIQDLIVRPECQKMGVGKLIINRLIEYVDSITEEDNEMMLCLMCAKGREEFYKRFGFVARPTDNLGPGMIQYRHK